MISPFKAKTLIRQNAVVPKVEKMQLAKCFGSVLAADIKAPFPMPIADNSAMDGFVIRSSDVCRATAEFPSHLKIQGTIKAGDSKQTCVAKGTAFRIMTGAVIPRNGDAVIPKEEAVILGDCLVLSRSVRHGQHIRCCAEEIKKGQKLLRKGDVLNPAAVGILASMGYASIPVYRKPRVIALATGSELVAPGKKLDRGKVYDLNSWMIHAALEQMGVAPFRILTLHDDVRKVRKAIRNSLDETDYLILLGGVSVGDYDVVKEALKKEGVKTIFWKVNQKPGKPLFFGRKGKKIIFGLPGNPAAVFTCFYEYVYPALRRSMGFENCDLKQTYVKVDEAISADRQKHLYLKARVLNQKTSKGRMTAKILSYQGSHMLSSLNEAQGFLHVPPHWKGRQKERELQFHFLPGAHT